MMCENVLKLAVNFFFLALYRYCSIVSHVACDFLYKFLILKFFHSLISIYSIIQNTGISS